MWDVKACRSCLTVKGKLEKIGDASKRQYSAITGLQILESDGYPNYFCVECRLHIRKSLAFRRKSRRAHFVLKEIMAVRKQISYSDIVTVNRKKTNLESSLNFWEPSKNSCYLLADEEGQEEECLKKYDLEEPQARLHSKHLVDIKPDQDTELPEEVTEQEDEEFFNDDMLNNDSLGVEPDIDTTNIDMNDIFKDLTEDNNSDNDDDYIEPLEPVKEKKSISANNELVKTKFIDLPKMGRQSVTAISNLLLIYDLSVLNLDEQKERFEFMKRNGRFVKAQYKCAMCLTVHKDMDDLMEHVKFHNERKFEHECLICKNKFPTEEQLHIHVANSHLYEYNCRLCRARIYSRIDAIGHAKSEHKGDVASAKLDVLNRREERKIALSNFTITTLSQRMMSDVMMLRSRPEHSRPKERDAEKQGQDGKYKCDICGISLKLRISLEKHMVLKHRYMYTCNLCKEIFTTRLQALQHNEEAHMQHKCEDCGKIFEKMQRLKSHRSQKHSKRIPCNVCGHSAKNQKYFYKHQMLEHGYISINHPSLGDPQYKCGTEECGVQFVNRRSLEVHIVDMNHAGAENVPFACVPCKKLCENEEDLETHYITCRDANNYPRKCCYCTEELHNALAYKLHYIHQHPTLQYRYARHSAICDICGKSIYKPLLESHLRTHDGTAFSCRLCANYSPSAVVHVTHVLANHARRPYKCSLCPRSYKSRSDCKDHILKVHAPTKLFKCEFCGAEFSYFRNLKEHAEKLHNLVIPTIKPKVALKNKNTIYVYAHMKIIINELEREVVQKTRVELLDYLDQKSKQVDANDYFILDPQAEEVSLCMKKKTKKKKKKKTEVETAVAQITVEWEPETKGEAGHEEIGEKREAEDIGENSEMVDEKFETQTDMEVDNLEIDSEKPLEVVESEGHQYVMINGEMYRIAAEDDD